MSLVTGDYEDQETTQSFVPGTRALFNQNIHTQGFKIYEQQKQEAKNNEENKNNNSKDKNSKQDENKDDEYQEISSGIEFLEWKRDEASKLAAISYDSTNESYLQTSVKDDPKASINKNDRKLSARTEYINTAINKVETEMLFNVVNNKPNCRVLAFNFIEIRKFQDYCKEAPKSRHVCLDFESIVDYIINTRQKQKQKQAKQNNNNTNTEPSFISSLSMNKCGLFSRADNLIRKGTFDIISMSDESLISPICDQLLNSNVYPYLTSLNLSSCGLCSDHCLLLGKGLKLNGTLEYLSLNQNPKITGRGFEAILNGILGHKKLRRLDWRENPFSISPALQKKRGKAGKVKVKGKGKGKGEEYDKTDCSIVLRDFLSDKECYLGRIYLTRCRIDDEMCKNISDGLNNNKYMYGIILNQNKISDIGMKYFCQMLGNCNNFLRNVEMQYNPAITSESGKYLKDALAKNDRIAKLDLSRCGSFGDEGVLYMCGYEKKMIEKEKEKEKDNENETTNNNDSAAATNEKANETAEAEAEAEEEKDYEWVYSGTGAISNESLYLLRLMECGIKLTQDCGIALGKLLCDHPNLSKLEIQKNQEMVVSDEKQNSTDGNNAANGDGDGWNELCEGISRNTRLNFMSFEGCYKLGPRAGKQLAKAVYNQVCLTQKSQYSLEKILISVQSIEVPSDLIQIITEYIGFIGIHLLDLTGVYKEQMQAGVRELVSCQYYLRSPIMLKLNVIGKIIPNFVVLWNKWLNLNDFKQFNICRGERFFEFNLRTDYKFEQWLLNNKTMKEEYLKNENIQNKIEEINDKLGKQIELKDKELIDIVNKCRDKMSDIAKQFDEKKKKLNSKDNIVTANDPTLEKAFGIITNWGTTEMGKVISLMIESIFGQDVDIDEYLPVRVANKPHHLKIPW